MVAPVLIRRLESDLLGYRDLGDAIDEEMAQHVVEMRDHGTASAIVLPDF